MEQYLFGIPYQKLPSYSTKEPVGDKPVPARRSINVELLEEILAYIKAHPNTWVQESWYKNVDPETGYAKYFSKAEEVTESNSCGTSFCFAGHVAIHEGFPAPPIDGSEWWRRVVDEDGREYHEEAYEFAEHVLGLSFSQAEALFAGDNSIEELETIVEILKLEPNFYGTDIAEVQYYMNEYDLSVKDAIKKYLEP